MGSLHLKLGSFYSVLFNWSFVDSLMLSNLKKGFQEPGRYKHFVSIHQTVFSSLLSNVQLSSLRFCLGKVYPLNYNPIIICSPSCWYKPLRTQSYILSNFLAVFANITKVNKVNWKLDPKDFHCMNRKTKHGDKFQGIPEQKNKKHMNWFEMARVGKLSEFGLI